MRYRCVLKGELGKIPRLQLSLIAIITVVFVEGAIGLIINSLALISDAMHATFDAVTTLLLLLATHWSLKPPDENHTYGHGKIESIGGLVGGIALFALSLVLIYESAIRLINGGIPVIPGFIGFFAVFYTLGVDFFRISILKGASESITVKTDLFHAICDLSSTLIALLGIFLASRGLYIGDAFASIGLGLLLIYLSIKLAYTTSMELSDAIPSSIVRKIEGEIRNINGVLECKDLKVRKVGSTTFVEATITLPEFFDFEESHFIASRAESSISKLMKKSEVVIHVEPKSREIPLETLVKKLAMDIKDVKDVHNINVTYANGKLYVILHAQVDPDISLEGAHIIAEQIEKSITNQIKDVNNVTVHIESFTTEFSEGQLLFDKKVFDVIIKIIKNHSAVSRVNKIMTYIRGSRRYINIHCCFDKKTSIVLVHNIVSDIEKEIKEAFNDAEVTIHSEPG